LEELRGELAEAETFHDTGRIERARREIDFLMQELASATGLGGRDRRVSSAAERARVNVSRSVVRALERIERNIPDLGEHLRRNIKTGTFCKYAPPAPTEWEF
jgi:non-specific serine/threonine protein kinase